MEKLVSDPLRDLVLPRLEAVRQSGGSFTARCPAHEDRMPSLSITAGKEHPVVFDCKAGCHPDDVIAAIGLTWEDLCKPREPQDKPTVVAEYRYTDEQGQPLYVIKRYEPGFDGERKTFRPYLPGAQRAGLGQVRRVLYRLPQVLAAISDGQAVYIVEGEKDADRLAALGQVATCNPGGASKPGDSKWQPEFAALFTGADVTIIADRDTAGRTHARNVHDTIKGIAKSVCVLQAAVTREHADLSDHLAAGLALDQLVPLDLSDRADDSSTNDEQGEQSPSEEDRFPRVDWKQAFATDFSQIDWLAGRFMERGQQVGLVGPGKSGKSLFADNWIWCAITGRGFLGDQGRDPIRVLYLDRENSLRDIVTRMTSLGATPDELERLDYRMFPRFSGALDASAMAAQQLLTLVDESQPDVVVLDTVSRYIGGKENDADTWLQLYGRIHAPLKALNVACLRLDHMGKDEDRGSRGSSAKTQDVDHVWELTKVGENKSYDSETGVETITTSLKLNRTHTRTGLGEDLFLITRRGLRQKGGMWLAGGTRHALSTGFDPEIPAEGTAEWLADRLDEHGVPAEWGSPRIATACRELGIKAGKTKIEETVRIRKARGLGDLPRHLPYPPVTETSPDHGGSSGVSAGQTSPGEVGGRSGGPHIRPTSPHPLPREGGGRAGQRSKDGESGICGGCLTVMTVLQPGQLWHVGNNDCERLYLERQEDATP